MRKSPPILARTIVVHCVATERVIPTHYNSANPIRYSPARLFHIIKSHQPNKQVIESSWGDDPAAASRVLATFISFDRKNVKINHTKVVSSSSFISLLFYDLQRDFTLCPGGRAMLYEASKCLTESHINLVVAEDFSQVFTSPHHTCELSMMDPEITKGSSTTESFQGSTTQRVFFSVILYIFWQKTEKREFHIFFPPPNHKRTIHSAGAEFEGNFSPILLVYRTVFHFWKSKPVSWRERNKSVDWQTIIIAFYRYTKKKL